MTDLNQSEDSKNTVNQRRVFLKRASAVSLIAALPVKNVWGTYGSNGCTVSGNMSGNASQHEQCTVQGKSPGYWKNHLHESVSNKSWSDIFGSYRPPLGLSSSKSSKTVYDFLDNPGNGRSGLGGSDNINYILIAAYCNALYGRYPLQPNVTAEGYVKTLYDEAEATSTYQIATAIKSTYD